MTKYKKYVYNVKIEDGGEACYAFTARNEEWADIALRQYFEFALKKGLLGYASIEYEFSHTI
jgi:hypothetical protein